MYWRAASAGVSAASEQVSPNRAKHRMWGLQSSPHYTVSYGVTHDQAVSSLLVSALHSATSRIVPSGPPRSVNPPAYCRRTSAPFFGIIWGHKLFGSELKTVLRVSRENEPRAQCHFHPQLILGPPGVAQINMKNAGVRSSRAWFVRRQVFAEIR